MENFKFLSKEEINSLPKEAGVYAFKKRGQLLYIGKAASIKERVKNHFNQPSHRDGLFIDKINKIGFIETNSEIEALLLEAELIKQHQPKFNIVWRDDKNYFYVCISRGERPVVSVTHRPPHGKEYRMKNVEFRIKKNSTFSYVGPFVDGTSLKKTLRTLRLVFPFYTQKNHPQKLCLWCHLKLCPGPNPNYKEHKRDIKNLTAILKGQKQSVQKSLRREMEDASKANDFERAAKLRDQIFSLEKVMQNARVLLPDNQKGNNWEVTQKILRRIINAQKDIQRIEAYDIANIQGKEATGSMTVATNGMINKKSYRKFKIKIKPKPNDVAMIKEVVSRRLAHPEWPYPEIMLIDGGKPQLNAALLCLKNQRQSAKKSAAIRIMALAKKKEELYIEGKDRPILAKDLPREIFNLILTLRDEAHRFARVYHHKLRKIDAVK